MVLYIIEKVLDLKNKTFARPSVLTNDTWSP